MCFSVLKGGGPRKRKLSSSSEEDDVNDDQSVKQPRGDRVSDIGIVASELDYDGCGASLP